MKVLFSKELSCSLVVSNLRYENKGSSYSPVTIYVQRWARCLSVREISGGGREELKTWPSPSPPALWFVNVHEKTQIEKTTLSNSQTYYARYCKKINIRNLTYDDLRFFLARQCLTWNLHIILCCNITLLHYLARNIRLVYYHGITILHTEQPEVTILSVKLMRNYVIY